MSALSKAAFAVLMLCAVPAGATTVCYPREQMVTYISRDFSATQIANGIVRPFSVMELWVSQEDGDWIVVTTDLDNNSCIIAYGENFSDAPTMPVEKG